jgi:translocator protein
MCPSRNRVVPVAGTLTTAVVGSLATDPRSSWFRELEKPAWYPPAATFGVVWTGLYAATAWAAGEVLARAGADRRPFARAFTGNLLLNAAWTPLFFRAHRPWAATAECAVLTASTVDLPRRAARVSRPAAAALAPYAAWTAFATALSGAIARRNPRGTGVSPRPSA